MTLVVAGFESDGKIIFCGDSLITTRANGLSVKLTSKFRKIIPLEIVVRVPEFDPSGKITRYVDTTSWHRCMIAFAGSTLVSQHIINSIQGHLRRIKFTYDNGNYDYSEGGMKGAGYKLIMGCENNETVENTYWDEEIFISPSESANNFLNKDFLVNLFRHCIQGVIDDFHLQTNENFHADWFASDFIVALTCYKTEKNHLFTFKMEFNEISVSLRVEEIGVNDLAIIGISRYSKEIINEYNKNKGSLSTESILSSEMIKAVKDNEDADLREIGLPVVLKCFDSHRELRDKQRSWR